MLNYSTLLIENCVWGIKLDYSYCIMVVEIKYSLAVSHCVHDSATPIAVVYVCFFRIKISRT